MTVIFGTLKDVGGQLAQGTVTVSSLMTRPAHGAASTVITKERHVLPLLNGAFESPELDPGPVLIEAASGGAFESWEVTLPEDGRHDLATLVESQHVYEPPVVGAAQAAAQEAREAAGRAVAAADGVDAAVAGAADSVLAVVAADADRAVAARADAVSARRGAEDARDGAVVAADRAEGAAGGVAADAVAAGDAAGRAEVAADAAGASAAAAGASAGEAADSATAAQGHAEDADVSARSAAESASNAKMDSDWVRGPGLTAMSEINVSITDAADRAEAAAAGVDQVVSDAAGALATEIADDVAASQAARSGAVSARDQAVGAASTASTKADEAAASAGTADSRATDAEGAVASIAAHATAAQGHADRAVDAREGAEAALDEASGMLAQKADLVGGLVPSSQIPAVAMTRPHVVADVAGLLALDVQEGDVGIIPDGSDRGSYMLGTGPATEFGSWKRLVTPEAPVSSVNGQTGTVTLGAADVGAATPTYVDGKVETRATKAEMQARPAFWLWDGTVPWTPPPYAQAGDTVLNIATKELHTVEEVA